MRRNLKPSELSLIHIYQRKVFRNLNCKRIQCDEIWQFCYAKEKNVPAEKKGQFGFGDVWTWVAIDADTKLIPTFLLGNRDARTANGFIEDLASRLSNRIQLTTDGLRVYLEAVSYTHLDVYKRQRQIRIFRRLRWR